MMGRLEVGQGELFYDLCLEKLVPPDHPSRKLYAVLDLSWVSRELAPYYSHTGRPSVDPELMIRMLIVGYVFAIRSERQLCSEVQVNMAYRLFCGLGMKIRSRTTRCFRAPATSGFGKRMCCGACSSAWLGPASRRVLWTACRFRSMPAISGRM